MSPDFLHQLNTEIKHQKADIETIGCGVDRYGPQIFVIDEFGRDHCYTPIGFAAIGDGGRHAASQFMFARYSPHWSLSRALYLLYASKKHAEVAPGVGEDTDMFFIGYPGKPMPINDELMGYLKIAYGHVREETKTIVEGVNATLEQYLAEMLSRGSSPTTQTPPAEQSPPPELPTEPEPPPVNPT
jgi:hypothetical protein